MLLPHMVVKGKVGSGPCTGCPQNGQSRFGTSCTTALQFSSQDTWPSVYDPSIGPVKGRCWSKNCFAHFSIHSFHFTFIMITIKIWRKKRFFFPRFVSMEMAAIFDFRELTKVHITLKRLLQMQ